MCVGEGGMIGGILIPFSLLVPVAASVGSFQPETHNEISPPRA